MTLYNCCDKDKKIENCNSEIPLEDSVEKCLYNFNKTKCSCNVLRICWYEDMTVCKTAIKR